MINFSKDDIYPGWPLVAGGVGEPEDKGSARDFLDVEDPEEAKDETVQKDDDKEEDTTKEEDNDSKDDEDGEAEGEGEGEGDSDDTELDDEDEEEDKEEEEEDELELQGSDLPSFKQIKSKYPKFFKDFPELAESYAQFRRIIKEVPDLDSVKELKVQAQSLDFFRDSIEKGELQGIFKAVRDGEALETFATSFLPQLNKFDRRAFEKAIDPVMKDLIKAMSVAGERQGDKNLINSAKIMCRFLYNSYDLPKDEEHKADPKLENERKRLLEEKTQFENTKRVDLAKLIERRATKAQMKEIERHIPKSLELSEFVKDALVKRVLNMYAVLHNEDKRYAESIRALWTQAKNEGYSASYADKIIGRYLARQKYLVPKLVSKVLSELKKTSKAEDKEDSDRSEKLEKKPEKKLNKSKPLNQQYKSAREFLDS